MKVKKPAIPADSVNVLLLVALGTGLVAQWWLGRTPSEKLAWPLAVYALAVLLTVIALRDERLRTERDLYKVQAASPTRPQAAWQRWAGRGLIFISLPTAALGGVLLRDDWQRLGRAMGLYGIALLLAVVGFTLMGRWSVNFSLRYSWAVVRRRCPIAVALFLVLGLGIFLRVYRLDYYPPPGGISWGDEAQIGKDAYGVLRYGHRPASFPLTVYATVLSFRLLGETVQALRWPCLLYGLLTLLSFYGLATELLGHLGAIVATFLLAISRWHISFIRLVLPSTPSLFMEVTCFWLLLRGFRTGGRVSYLGAALAMGLGMYEHASFRVVPVIVLILFLMRGVSSLRSPRRFDWGGAIVFLAAFLLVVTPYIFLVRRDPLGSFTERFTSVMPILFAGPAERAIYLASLGRQASEMLLFFNYRGEGWAAINLPGAAMLDPVSGVLFVFGLAYALFYFWQGHHLFLASWFLLTALSGGILTESLRSHRFIGVLPAIFLLAGSLIDRIWALGRTVRFHRWATIPALILLLLAAGWANYDLLFNRQIHDPRVRIEFDHAVSAIANRIRALGGRCYVVLFAEFPFYRSGHDYAWMAGEPPGERGESLSAVLPYRGETDLDLAYLFLTPYDGEAMSAAVQAIYPEAIVEHGRGPYREYRYLLVQVPHSAVVARRGLTGLYYANEGDGEPVPPSHLSTFQPFGLLARYFAGAEGNGSLIKERIEPVLALQDVPSLWGGRPLPELEGKSYRSEWEAQFTPEEAGIYNWRVSARGGTAVLFIDELEVVRAYGTAYSQDSVSGGLWLTPGEHHFRLLYTFTGGDFDGVSLRWRPPGKSEEVINPGLFRPLAGWKP